MDNNLYKPPCINNLMYKQRDVVDDKTIKVTMTIDRNLFYNLQLFRKEHGIKSLSSRVNELVWVWFNKQLKQLEAENNQ